MGLFDTWGRTHPITVDNSKIIGTGSHANFLMLVTLDHLDSEVTDAGSNSALNGGGDIRFTSDAAGNTRLNLHVVNFVTNASPASQACVMWVDITSLSTSADTTIYIWYNKAGQSQPGNGDAFGRNAAWAGAELAVLMESTTPEDSTGNHTLSLTGSLTGIAGPFGAANEFASNNRLSNSDVSLRDILLSYDTTVSAISRRASFVSNLPVVSWSGTDDFALYPMEDDGAPNEGARAFWRDVANNFTFMANNVSAVDVWAWTAFTTRATNDHELYQNGVSVATDSGSGTAGPFTEFLIGGFSGGSSDWDGDIAQIVVWKTERPAGWLTTEYNNQQDPSTFASSGTPSTPGGGGGVAVPVFIQHYRNQGMI